MEDHKIERSAMLMIEKYGDKALSKAVSAAMHYTENNDEEGASRWIKIGYAIRQKQKELVMQAQAS